MTFENKVSRYRKHKLRLIDDSDEAWREYGRSDPYFGVLTEDKFRKGNLTPKALAEFFDSGESHVASVLATLRDHLAPSLQMRDALDFGCGVGRLVVPLASRFESVTGIDISEAYRSEAADNCRRREISNARFLEKLEPLVKSDARFDFVHSCIVFNHIPWERGRTIITQMFDLLRPQGAMAIQVMICRQTTTFRRIGSWLRRNFLPLNWLINVLRGRPAFEPLMQGNEYRLGDLLPILTRSGAGAFHLRLDITPEGHVFALIFCTKLH
jgi:2-polyprenyl-3-methyl-5-hydroxy-6-metoxy-1,4-benzoquinol methylase